MVIVPVLGTSNRMVGYTVPTRTEMNLPPTNPIRPSMRMANPILDFVPERSAYNVTMVKTSMFIKVINFVVNNYKICIKWLKATSINAL